jgi:adenosine deaminase
MCPLSNVRLRCVNKVEELPVRRFLEEGVRFSINSDDPAYFGGYILDNYCAVQEAFGLSVKEWRYIAEGAIEGSWCDEGRKKELLVKVEEWAEKYKEVA